ncbi:MAG: PBP1A family penicillin-binding protein [Acidobacteria bacterium]|nr:PBP1A family penicillin-binding protein [Acidobacteriota bacterium]
MRVIIQDGKRWETLVRPFGRVMVATLLLAVVGGAGIFTFYYVRYSRLIDERLSRPVFPNVSQIYAAPEKLRVGERITRYEVAAQLRLAGFSESQDDTADTTQINSKPKGRFRLTRRGIQIHPGPDSYFSAEPAELEFSDGRLSSIISGKDQFARHELLLEPILITNLFDSSREKRRLVKYPDLPQNLVNAMLSIEDRRFFDHIGIDFLRLAKAIYVDVSTGSARQGASTITQQLARSLFLTQDKTIRRKLAEAMVALQLENRLSKEEIFEHYCNTIYLGYRGSFSILGMGEAAQAYFRKDVAALTLPEAAMLAGIIQSPNRYSPYRNPDLVLNRRKTVLDAMLDTDAITQQQHDDAVAAPLVVSPSHEVSGEAPHFVDMVKRRLLERFSEEELTSQSYRVYTTLDMRLQTAASEAVRAGMEELDKRLAGLRRPRNAQAEDPAAAPVRPEVALVALDRQTGEIKALIGGRNYGISQLNRALASRQPGSIFKPFVYAAALTAYQKGTSTQPWTPMSTVLDEPTTFEFDKKQYQPANYGRVYYGDVTLRTALMKSLNVSTVKLAESIGYDTVVALARRAGINNRIKPTPSIALGAYEITPVEIAGAYTIFANQGIRLDPYFLSVVRNKDGGLLDINYPRKTPVLEPAVAYVMTNMMEDVINHGTGAPVRARGFTAPAAGKTGTTQDGWFAGYTSNLITIVWVGYDDNRELRLTGGAAALPIWTEFMKRAIALPLYSDVREIAPPDAAPEGAVVVSIDPATGELATPACPGTITEFFIKGTEPTKVCHLHYSPEQDRVAAAPPPPSESPSTPAAPVAALPTAPAPIPVAAAPETSVTVPVKPQPAKPAEPPRKKGFWGRIFGG